MTSTAKNEVRDFSLQRLDVEANDIDAAELVSMNETFVKARTMFDRMMEDSLARHSGRMYHFYRLADLFLIFLQFTMDDQHSRRSLLVLIPVPTTKVSLVSRNQLLATLPQLLRQLLSHTG